MEMIGPIEFLIRGAVHEGNYSTQVTASILDESGERPVKWSSLFLAAFMVLGAAGNALVCIAISTDRRLQNVTNYFLFSLAIADLLVSLIVMPFSILNELHDGYWYYGFNLCASFTYADVFLCSASIVHMSIISLDRYLGISRPLKTRNKSKLVVTFKIIIVWIITTMISCPIVILAVVSAGDIYHDQICSIKNRYFLIYGSTLAFLIPCLIMLATFVRTTQLLRQQALLCSGSNSSDRSHNGHPMMSLRRSRTQRPSKTGSGKHRGSSESKSAASRRNSPSLTSESGSKRSVPNRTNAHEVGGGQVELHRSDRLQIVLPVVMRKNGSNSHCSHESVEASSGFDHQRPSSPNDKTLSKKFRDRTITLWHKTRHKAVTSDLANEQKATRVLGLVFGCFVVCWTPFFVQNFALAFCGGRCHAPQWMASVILWLGYLSSTINPIIYTIFNKRFRQAFANVLRCRCRRSSTEAHARPSRASASSYHSVNSNYFVGNANGLTTASLTSPFSFAGSSYAKCSITKLPINDLNGIR